MKSKCAWIWVILFWLAFLSVVAIVFYTSFQSGEDAAKLGKGLITKLAVSYFNKDTISSAELSRFTCHLRQLLRTAAFICVGVLGTAAIHVSFRRIPWIIKTLLAGSIVLVLAWITEKGKIYLPTRHYSYNQMMISIVSALLGFLLVSAITLIRELIYYLNRKTKPCVSSIRG